MISPPFGPNTRSRKPEKKAAASSFVPALHSPFHTAAITTGAPTSCGNWSSGSSWLVTRGHLAADRLLHHRHHRLDHQPTVNGRERREPATLGDDQPQHGGPAGAFEVPQQRQEQAFELRPYALARRG